METTIIEQVEKNSQGRRRGGSVLRAVRGGGEGMLSNKHILVWFLALNFFAVSSWANYSFISI